MTRASGSSRDWTDNLIDIACKCASYQSTQRCELILGVASKLHQKPDRLMVGIYVVELA